MDGNTTIRESPSVASGEQVRLFYETRLKTITGITRNLTTRYRFLINIEFGLLLLLAVVFYLLYTHHLIDPFAGTAVYAAGGLLVLSVPGTLLARTFSRLQAQRKIAEYYETRKQRLDGTWPGGGDKGSDFAVADHQYCIDLDIVGKGSLFEYLCSAKTGAGREWLANVLLSPASPNDILARQQAIGELRDRHDLHEYFAATGATGVCKFEGKSLKQWSTEAPTFFSPLIRLAGACLCVINIVIIALALSGRISPEAPLGTLAAVGLFTAALRKKTGREPIRWLYMNWSC